MNIETNPFKFGGRIGRAGFIWTSLIITVCQFVLEALIDPLERGVDESQAAIALVICLIALGLLILAMGCGIKRLRDLKKSPWMVLLGFIPLVGFIVWLYLACAKSKYDGVPPELNYKDLV